MLWYTLQFYHKVALKYRKWQDFIILKLCTIQASIPVEIKFTVTDLSKLDKETFF